MYALPHSFGPFTTFCYLFLLIDRSQQMDQIQSAVVKGLYVTRTEPARPLFPEINAKVAYRIIHVNDPIKLTRWSNKYRGSLYPGQVRSVINKSVSSLQCLSSWHRASVCVSSCLALRHSNFTSFSCNLFSFTFYDYFPSTSRLQMKSSVLSLSQSQVWCRRLKVFGRRKIFEGLWLHMSTPLTAPCMRKEYRKEEGRRGEEIKRNSDKCEKERGMNAIRREKGTESWMGMGSRNGECRKGI